MKKKLYYELTFTQRSPLRISVADSERTSKDLALDKRGMPFIPGFSIAGVLRSMMSDEASYDLFGGETASGGFAGSKVIVGDATLKETVPVKISVRDGVHLNEWGAVLNKYDYEIAETEYPYVSIVEWQGDEESYKKEIEEILDPLFLEIQEYGIGFGAGNSRGFGQMKAIVKKKVFTFPEDLSSWLDFDPYKKDDSSFETERELSGKTADTSLWTRIHTEFMIDGNFSISVPTARVDRAENGFSPDRIPLRNLRGNPVISGTTLAGSFRHHMLKLCRELGIDKKQVDELFGIKDERQKIYTASKIHFSECEITGGKNAVVTRNAVERFTGTPKVTGLFTAELCYGGSGELEISLSPEAGSLQKQLLAQAIYDLQLGLFAIGSESGTGRGRLRFKSFSVNGNDRTQLVTGRLQNSGDINTKDLLEA
ncbi:MAG: hypothetical protein K6G10_04815 [Butyrivibrio sp.]|nr:hypothetical protein [Butyrivibrio sp.]